MTPVDGNALGRHHPWFTTRLLNSFFPAETLDPTQVPNIFKVSHLL